MTIYNKNMTLSMINKIYSMSDEICVFISERYQYAKSI